MKKIITEIPKTKMNKTLKNNNKLKKHMIKKIKKNKNPIIKDMKPLKMTEEISSKSEKLFYNILINNKLLNFS